VQAKHTSGVIGKTGSAPGGRLLGCGVGCGGSAGFGVTPLICNGHTTSVHHSSTAIQHSTVKTSSKAY